MRKHVALGYASTPHAASTYNAATLFKIGFSSKAHIRTLASTVTSATTGAINKAPLVSVLMCNHSKVPIFVFSRLHYQQSTSSFVC